jgi:FkbM family methyltransferase
MLASRLRSMAQRVRHAPGLRSLDGVWDSVRPLYSRALEKLSGDKGVEIRIAECTVRLSPRFAGAAWESIERDSYDSFAKAIRPGDIVYDVGAHIGTYSILALRRSAPRGRVVAYEPVELTREFLTRHLAWNDAGDRAIVRPICVGAEAKEARLYFREGEMNGDSGLVATAGSESRMVEVRTLDSEVAELRLIPAVIKIDVEGWEFEVLKGAEATLLRYRPVLFLSLHPRALAELHASPEMVQSWLVERGYTCRLIGVDHEIHLLARPSTNEELGAGTMHAGKRRIS